ncbi:MAG: TetR family transcriptional regulator [Acidisphaera sp.]|nr:TetR family transcriptional regulator [Acidisphaera sp.]
MGERRRDAKTSRQALLAAGRAVFAAKGFAGSRVEAIARRAGLNKQLVYHYFGSKDGLYQAVLEQAYADIRAREQALVLADLPPELALRELVLFSFDYLRDHPHFIALLNDENLCGAQHVRRSRELTDMHAPLIALIDRTLRAGAAGGCFRHDIDPLQLYISIAALPYFYFSNTATLSAIFRRDLRAPAEIAARRRHVLEFVMAAVRSERQAAVQERAA